MIDNPTFVTQRSIDVATADRIIAVADAAARDDGIAVCIAVVDGGGHLVSFRRMDGAWRGSIDAAIGKARSCAGFETPLIKFGEMAKKGETWVGDLPGLIPLGGAVPLQHDGAFVGAVSVSGDTEDKEQALAELAAAALV